MSAPSALPELLAQVSTRKPGLDLLRAMAIILVVLFHGGIFGFILPGQVQRFGWIGVDLFFVLSGYLIGGQLLASMAAGRQIDLPRFFRRRALRILPAYIAVLLVYAALPALREYPPMPPLWRFVTFTQNIGLHGGTAFSHAWSLCVEGQFYLILPFLLWLAVPRKHGGWFLAGTVILGGVMLRAALASFLLRSPETSGSAFQTLIYYPTWARLDPLALGVGLAAIEQFRPGWWQRLLAVAPWLLLPGFGAIAAGLFLAEKGVTWAACVWQFPLIALGLAMLLVCAVSPRLPFAGVAVPGTSLVARGSYSVYLSHKLTVHAVAAYFSARGIPLNTGLAIGLDLLLVSLVGGVLFFAVERPFLQLRD